MNNSLETGGALVRAADHEIHQVHPVATISSRSSDLGPRIFGLAAVLAVSSEYVLSYSIFLSELVVLSGLIWFALTGKPLRYRASFVVLGLGMFFALVPIFVWGWGSAYLAYEKTFVDFFAGLLFWDVINNNRRTTGFVLSSIMTVSAVLAVYGIAQAFIGIGVLPDVYLLGGVQSAKQIYFQNLYDESYKLIGVMKWKTNTINSAFGAHILNGLAYGFHSFSQNFGEYLVFASVSIGISRATKVIILIVQCVIFTAILCSASRTAIFGFIIVQLTFIVVLSKSRWLLVLVVVALVSIIFVFIDWKLFLFDDGSSVEGRSEYNSMALDFIMATPLSTLFGGDAGRYALISYSNVHFTALYYWLYGGIFVAVSMMSLFGVWTWRALRDATASTRSPNSRRLAAAVSASMIWFLFYGLTWSPVAIPNTIIILTFFVTLIGQEGDDRPTNTVQSLPHEGTYSYH